MRGSVMQPRALLPVLLASANQAVADLLYVSSYSGSVTTLNLTATGLGSDAVPALEAVSSSQGCGASPSWLTLDHANAVLYCVDEAVNGGQGSLASLRTNSDGSLTQLDLVKSVNGPVSAVIYGNGNGLTMAHYGGSAISSWNIGNPSEIQAIQTETFKLDGPPADPDRQDAPHPHEAVTDPTGKYILVPDLGADYVRVYTFDDNTLRLTAHPPLKATPGSGPRHLSFAQKDGKTFMYLVTELKSTIIGYEVTYGSSIEFKQLFEIGVYGKDKPIPANSFASEIVVSPDNNFLIVSDRGDNKHQIPNFDPNSSTQIGSDSLINFSIANDGSLTPIQEVAAGGSYPRQFSLNKAGTRVAVGMQKDSRVVVLERDPTTGELGKFVGYANVAGEITSVIFDE